MPSFLAHSTCLDTKNVKFHSILLQRWLQTSCSIGREMGMCLPICMMTVFKNAAPGHCCASYCTSRTKDSPNRQTICQARSSSYAHPTRKGCVAACQPAGWAAGLASGPAAPAPEEGHEGHIGKRRNEVTLQVFTRSFSSGRGSMAENPNPPAAHQRGPDDHVTSAGSFPQVHSCSLVHCTAQPQGRVMWVKHRVLCLNM